MADETEYDELAGAAGSVRGAPLIEPTAPEAACGDTAWQIDDRGGPDLPTGWRTTAGSPLNGPAILP